MRDTLKGSGVRHVGAVLITPEHRVMAHLWDDGSVSDAAGGLVGRGLHSAQHKRFVRDRGCI